MDVIMPVKLKELLYDMLRISNQMETTFYLVGGSVRDALLNHSFFDLDFVVDDGIEAIWKGLKEKYVVKRSLLETLNFECDGYNVDIAVFRRESYSGHSGMPTLSQGTFEEDLWRRDFTINTAYVKLDAQTIHCLLTGHLEVSHLYKSHPNFESDLRNGTLRILKRDSFLEDPTRLLRAVKYLCVLNLKFDKETEMQFLEAIEARVIHQCALGRYKKILYQYVQRHLYRQILEQLNKYDLLRGTHSADFFIKTGVEVIQAFPEANRPIFVMLALYENDLAFLNGIHSQITVCVNEILKYLKEASKVTANTDYMWYLRLKNLKVETLMFLIFTARTSVSEKNKINYFYKCLKDIKVQITGDDMLRMGIPSGEIMGRLKADLLGHKVNSGALMSKIDEINWIERKYYEY